MKEEEVVAGQWAGEDGAHHGTRRGHLGGPRCCGRTGPEDSVEETYSPTPCQRFRESSYWEAEGPRQFCARLHRLCRQWLRPEWQTKAEMLDQLILEQLLDLLPQEILSWVRECGAETSSQAVDLAETYLALSWAGGKLLEEPEAARLPVDVQPDFFVATKPPFDPKLSLPGGGTSQAEEEVANMTGAGRVAGFCVPSSVPYDAAGADQIPVTFEEVAVRFTLEQWALLDLGQMSLHKEVMEENMESVAFLGVNWRRRSISPQLGERARGKKEPGGSQRTYREGRNYIQEKAGRCIGCGERAEKHAPMLLPGRSQAGEEPVAVEDSGGPCCRFPSHKEVHAGERPFGCQECGKRFAQRSVLANHQKVHTGEKPYRCLECGKCFPHNSNLATHRLVHTGEKPHRCQECGKRFAQNAHLASHKRVHTGEKPHRCQECGKYFARKPYLAIHKRIHTGEKPYRCQECGRCFTHMSSLVIHKKVHTGEKPHQCLVCGKCFPYNSYLVNHLRVHTGEKPHRCQVCGKCFGQASYLVSHHRVHTGEKPHRCPECGKCFTQISSLVIHKRVHTGEKPHRCPECGKCFSYNSNLVKHRKIHMGEKPHRCPECGECFARNRQLVRHREVHRGESCPE